ncbi:hypothetical protein AAG570_006473 [Ranatra chinensis]|uniref:non-specific serine/threonine protein kinase n=1 Tax=Ranatra chinensis TaxID=642074 RepID=A0ABD0YW88_9HEMI
MVAMKIIDLAKNPQAKDYVGREVKIHKMLSDPHIIRYYGWRKHGNLEYIFLEYAPNGELFDRIEPDVGMSQWEAQKYLKQLISGVEYLHQRGVAHRDIKPENLLLDQQDNLKITDFGMATIFRLSGKERTLDKKCGTLPYVAPEVLCRPYAAEPADIWSCGIVLVAMLAGGKLTYLDCRDYLAWRSGRYMNLSPWSKVDNLALSLIQKVLCHVPSTRYTLKEIKAHLWFNNRENGNEEADGCSKKRRKGNDIKNGDVPPCSLSQPAAPLLTNDNSTCNNLAARFFSQPDHIQDMLIATQQLDSTQSLSQQNSWQKLVRRMTRFFVDLTLAESHEALISALQKLKLTWKSNTPGCITINTVDRRKSILVFKASIFEIDGVTLLDFRLSKGCGLEFKRHFLSIKSCLTNHVKPPTPWLI